MTQFIIVLSSTEKSGAEQEENLQLRDDFFLFISILCSLRISKILRRTTRTRRSRMKKWPNTSVDSVRMSWLDAHNMLLVSIAIASSLRRRMWEIMEMVKWKHNRINFRDSQHDCWRVDMNQQLCVSNSYLAHVKSRKVSFHCCWARGKLWWSSTRIEVKSSHFSALESCFGETLLLSLRPLISPSSSRHSRKNSKALMKLSLFWMVLLLFYRAYFISCFLHYVKALCSWRNYGSLCSILRDQNLW